MRKMPSNEEVIFDTVASIVDAKYFVNVETIKEKNYANS